LQDKTKHVLSKRSNFYIRRFWSTCSCNSNLRFPRPWTKICAFLFKSGLKSKSAMLLMVMLAKVWLNIEFLMGRPFFLISSEPEPRYKYIQLNLDLIIHSKILKSIFGLIIRMNEWKKGTESFKGHKRFQNMTTD